MKNISELQRKRTESDLELDAKYRTYHRRALWLVTIGLFLTIKSVDTFAASLFVPLTFFDSQMLKTLPVVAVACLMHGIINNIRCYQLRHGSLPCGPYEFALTYLAAWASPPTRRPKTDATTGV